MFEDATVRTVCQEKLWEYFRSQVRWSLKLLLEGFMEHERDLFVGCDAFERSSARKAYRNGYHERWLDTTLGLIKLRRPRVRGADRPFDSLVFDRYKRRQRRLDQAVLDWVACAVSTRDVSRLMQRSFEGVVSAGAVSRIVAGLDAQIRAFHARPLEHGYRFVFFDAKHGYISRKRKRRGRGKKKKAVLLLALGVRHDGSEELIDFGVADSESEKSWTSFMTQLERRGLARENRWAQKLQMIVSDGDAGLRAALWMVYPMVPKHRCVYHKLQDIQDHLRDRDHRKAIMASAGQIYDALDTPQQALRRLGRWVKRWADREPEAVRNFVYEFEDTLIYLNAPPEWRTHLKTTNPIERFIEELNRKIKNVGIFPSAASWERATYLSWQRLQDRGRDPTSPKDLQILFTHNS
jgi:putative transposase